MRHVAFLIPTLDQIGGAERQVILLAKGFVLRNWRVSVVALAGTGGAADGGLLGGKCGDGNRGIRDHGARRVGHGACDFPVASELCPHRTSTGDEECYQQTEPEDDGS